MPWVRFIADFEYRVTPRVILVYRAGREYLVKRMCAEQAVREGKAVKLDNDNRRRSTVEGSIL